jgi:protein O-mannosyl-transferase
MKKQLDSYNLKTLKIIGLILILIITTLVYSNHFENLFFFDDSHTIESNQAITSLNEWTTFFTDAKTFSSLPANRAYRPMITLMNAVDYTIAGGLNPTYFHYHIYFWYLVTIVLFFILIHTLFKKSAVKEIKELPILLLSLITTLFFAVHTINAETVNYICARSDSFSTLCVIAALLLFINTTTRRYHLYLIAMVIGIWTKQTALMFVPILFTYVILFEEKIQIHDLKNWFIKVFKVMALPAFVGGGLFLFNQLYLTPSSTHSTNFQVTKFEYISTQFYVMLHYLGNFILPTSLSADPDLEIIKPWYDKRILLGLFVAISMVVVAVKSVFKQKTLPIAFGIAWFFIASLPTSLVPLFQIANDHRMFFPFIGLFIAVGWGVFLFLNSKPQEWVKYSSLALVLVLILSYSYGTYQRNQVWKDAETLWKDVTVKSPKNGRGLMNYGLSQMAVGNYAEAEDYFLEAQKIEANYYVLEINLGVLYSALKNDQKAEYHFLKAISLNSSAPSPEYYYARYLNEKGQSKSAIDFLNDALQKSPSHIPSKMLLNSISSKELPPDVQIDILTDRIQIEKNNSDLYIELSEKLYTVGKFKEAVEVCIQLLKFAPDNKLAYNNMCASYNQLKEWDLAKIACENALKIDSNFQIAKNNLNWAMGELNNK